MNILQKKLALMILSGLVLSGGVYAEAGIGVGGDVVTNHISDYLSGVLDWGISEKRPIQWRLIFGGTSANAVFFVLFAS